MDLKRLRTFVTVADLGTVSKAAARRCVGRVPLVAPAWPRRHDRYRCADNTSAAAARFRLLSPPAVQCSLPCGRCRARYSGRELCAAHIARARRSRAGRRDNSVRAADCSLQADHRPRLAQGKTAPRPLCHPVGQAASYAELCGELLRGARRLYARGPSDYPTVSRAGVQTHALTIAESFLATTWQRPAPCMSPTENVRTVRCATKAAGPARIRDVAGDVNKLGFEVRVWRSSAE